MGNFLDTQADFGYSMGSTYFIRRTHEKVNYHPVRIALCPLLCQEEGQMQNG